MRVKMATAFVVCGMFMAGCTSVTFGVNPRTDRLTQLTPGQSRSSDVLLTLGEPRGKGAGHLSPDLPLRDVWFYELVKSDGRTADIKMLLVFMEGGVYDGYLWFSSLDKLKKSYSMTQR